MDLNEILTKERDSLRDENIELRKRINELDKNRNVFVMCHTGTRSQTVVKWLKSKGYEHSVNVLGGIDAWAALIDRSIRRY